MMKRIVILLLVINAMHVNAQNNASQYNWYFGTGLGANIGLTDLNQNVLSDELIPPSGLVLRREYLSVDCFIFKNFGVNYAMFNNGVSTESSVREQVLSKLQTAYPNYYIKNLNLDIYQRADDLPFAKLGLIYRTFKNNFVFIYRLSYANQYYGLYDLNVNLKENNTNNYLRISYEEKGEKNKKAWTITPSFTMGYTFAKHWIAHVDIAFEMIPMNMSYQYKKYDLFTHQNIESHIINYDKTMTRLGLTFGISLML